MPLKRFMQTPPQEPTRDYDIVNKKYVDSEVASVLDGGITQNIEVLSSDGVSVITLKFTNGILTGVDT